MLKLCKKYIKEQVDGYELKIIEQNQQTDVIRGTDISLEYKENGSIQKALDGQNPLLWPKAIFLQEFNGCYCGGRF